MIRSKTVLSALVILSFVAAPAYAYKLLGASWPDTGPVPYHVNTSAAPSGFASAIHNAAGTWTHDSRFDFDFRYAGLTFNATVNRDDGQHIVFWNKTGAGMDETTLATTYHWRAGTRMLHFDMAFNGRHLWTVGSQTGAYDIQTVAVHEFGHALGLQHSQQWSAVMFQHSPIGRTKRVLLADDVAGAATIYPPKVTVVKPDPVELHTPKGFVYDLKPNFTWNNARHADSYKLIVDRLEEGNTTTTVFRLDNLKTNSFRPAAAMMPGYHYRWRVIALSDSGQTSTSNQGEFSIRTTKPMTPVILSPSRITSSSRPVFSWQNSAGAKEYYIYISEIGGRNGIVHYRLSRNTFQPNFDMTHSRGYYWWVRAANGKQTSSWTGSSFLVK